MPEPLPSRREQPEKPERNDIEAFLTKHKSQGLTWRLEKKNVVFVYKGVFEAVPRSEFGRNEEQMRKRFRQVVEDLKQGYMEYRQSKMQEIPETVEEFLRKQKIPRLTWKLDKDKKNYIFIYKGTVAEWVPRSEFGSNEERMQRRFRQAVATLEQKYIDYLERKMREKREEKPATLRRISLTDEARKYGESRSRMWRDSYTERNPQFKSNKHLQEYFSKQYTRRAQAPGMRLKKTNHPDYPYAFVVNGTETWFIDAFSTPGHTTMTLLADDQITKTRIHIDIAKDLDLKLIQKQIEKAKANRQLEEMDNAAVRKFDLPKNRPIGYVCISDQENREKQGRLLPEFMNAAGYDMVQLEERMTIMDGSQDPKEVMSQNIEALHAAGVRDFYIHLLAHGNRRLGIAFLGKKGKTYISFGDLKEIFSRYPDCTFIINTIACFGGGYADDLEEFEDHRMAQEGRIVFFLHSKRDTTSYSYYNGVLTKYLNMMAEGAEDAPKTYGEAHYMTDLYLKKAKDLDAEYWKSRPGKKSIRTAKKEIGDNEQIA